MKPAPVKNKSLFFLLCLIAFGFLAAAIIRIAMLG